MKQYVHKHIVFEYALWEKINLALKERKVDNFTELLRSLLIKELDIKA